LPSAIDDQLETRRGRPLRVFYSYAHEDERLLVRLREHLAPLRRQNLIDDWHDRDINAGRDWEEEIDAHLEAADIILLLVSASFIASDYCYGREMERALEKHRSGAARVIPVILRSVVWTDSPIGRLQALPTDARPVTDRRDRDRAWSDVARGISKVVQELLGGGQVAPEAPAPAQSPLAGLGASRLSPKRPLIARAHIRFDGPVPSFSERSENVSGLTDHGLGSLTLTWDEPFIDENYDVLLTPIGGVAEVVDIRPGHVTLAFRDRSGVAADLKSIGVLAIGEGS
jgi:hypothetical protein